MSLHKGFDTVRHSTSLALAFIIGIALASRWWWAAQPRSVRWDEPDYLLLARQLLRGGGYHLGRRPELHTPPLVPYLAAAAVKLGIPLEHALLFWHVLAGVGLVIVLFGLARDLTGSNHIGLLAAFLAALSSALAVQPLYWGSMTESLFMVFLFAGLWATWRVLHSDSWIPAVLAGLAFGFSYLTRPEGLIWWALFWLIIAGYCIWKRRGWRSLFLYSLVFLVVAAPYIFYLYQHTGRIMLSGKTGLTATMSTQIVEKGNALGNDYGSMLDSSGEEILWFSPERYQIGLLDVIRADPVGEFRRIALNLQKAAGILVSPLLGLVSVALVVLGLWARPWDRRRIPSDAFLLAALLPLAIVPLFHVQTRLLVPWVPIALIWAARGLDHLMAWGGATLAPWPKLRWLGVLWSVLVIVAVLGVGLWGQRAAAQAGQASQMFSHEMAGRWLAEHTDPGSVVMSRNAEIGVYADRPIVALPNATWEDILTYGKARDARYLIVDSWEMDTVRPQLSALANPATAPPEVEYIIDFSDPVRRTFIYEIRAP